MMLGKEQHSRQREQNKGRAERRSNVAVRGEEKGVLGSLRNNGPVALGITLRHCLGPKSKMSRRGCGESRAVGWPLRNHHSLPSRDKSSDDTRGCGM